MPTELAPAPTSGQTHGPELRRELGARDLVFMQILVVAGGTWVGTAGKLGPANLALWLTAAVLFFVPHVLVVLFLSRWAPLEGGPYQWAKLAFGPGLGFLVAYDLWVTAILQVSSLGLDVVQALGYSFGRLAWMRDDPRVAPLATVGLVAVLAVESLAGLRVGKRFTNAGGAIRVGGYALLLLLPVAWLLLGRPLRAEATRIEAPPLTLLNVNLLAKMGFGAFCGLEYVAIFAGESRSPQRTFARSVAVAAPAIVVMFVAGTAAVLSFLAPAEIDLIAPIPQVIGMATAGLGPTAHLGSAVVVLFALAMVSQGSAMFAGITRLPMVAGWDGLLPAWFTRLSPRARVPVNSTLFVSGASVALALLGLVGVGHQEAYQTMASAGLVLWALTYLVMFAIVIVGRGPGMPRPPPWLRVAAASGFGMTLLFAVLAVFPIVHVESAVAFALKTGGIIVATNAIGAGLYLAERRARMRRREATAG